MKFFQNRRLIIATKHNKEQVISPIIEKELGVECFVDVNFDSDKWGTFTGEFERKLDPISTVREKCLSAMKLNNCDLGIASEGSFGNHPHLFFACADEEFLIFIDLKNKIEIVAKELSTSTNFNGRQIYSYQELVDFSINVGFPNHALIIRKSKDDNADVFKGIKDVETLQYVFEKLFLNENSLYVETDMRAMNNPYRMKIIEQTANKLVQQIKSTCPKCFIPGFGITEAKKGLECHLCGWPTNSIKSFLYICKHCQFSNEVINPGNKKFEDPTYCDHCNP